MIVKFFNPAKEYQLNRDEYLKAFDQVRSSGRLVGTGHQEILDFEKAFAEYTGTKYAISCNSGTDALFIALKAIGIKAGDEVITSSHTFVATIQVIIQCGATPILVDIGSDGLMDMEEVEKKITEKTRAIMPVHIAGAMCNMDDLLTYGIPII